MMTTNATPFTLTDEEIAGAQHRLAPTIRRTPLIDLEAGPLTPVGIVAKLELLQHTGSFKARGGLHALIRAGDLPEAGVVTASGGNHGQAIAWAAALRGAPATIVVPEGTSLAKTRAILSHGAEIVRHGTVYDEAMARALEIAESTGALFVHAFNHPDVIAGQATLGAELLDQLGDRSVDTVLVALGGGGLAAGVARAVVGRARVVAVEPELCPTYRSAREAGGPVQVTIGGAAADALGAARLGERAWDLLSAADAESVLVTDEDIMAARRQLWDYGRLVTEPGGAAALAALRSGAYRPKPGERVAVIVCGSNTDPQDLSPTALN
jgi:threonine dehydratase